MESVAAADRLLGGPPRLEGGGDDAGAQGLGQEQLVARPAARVGEHALGVHQAGDRVAELDLGIADAVPAQQHAARLRGASRRRRARWPRPIHREVLLGEGGDGERGQGPPAHGVHVGQGVGGGDGPEGRGVVHHRREEVHGLHQRRLLVEAEHARVVPRAVVHQDAGVSGGGEGAQDLSELGGTELARSTGAGDPLREPPDPFPVVRHLLYKFVYGRAAGSGGAPRLKRAARWRPRARRAGPPPSPGWRPPPCRTRPGRRPLPRSPGGAPPGWPARGPGQHLDALPALDAAGNHPRMETTPQSMSASTWADSPTISVLSETIRPFRRPSIRKVSRKRNSPLNSVPSSMKPLRSSAERPLIFIIGPPGRAAAACQGKGNTARARRPRVSRARGRRAPGRRRAGGARPRWRKRCAASLPCLGG